MERVGSETRFMDSFREDIDIILTSESEDLAFNAYMNDSLYLPGKWTVSLTYASIPQMKNYKSTFVSIELDIVNREMDSGKIGLFRIGNGVWSVSYTHLTLPTNREV